MITDARDERLIEELRELDDETYLAVIAAVGRCRGCGTLLTDRDPICHCENDE